MRTCSKPGCGGKHIARGLCSKHYQQRPKVRGYRKKYHSSAKHKAKLKKYRRSSKGRAWRHSWSRTLKALFYRGKISAKKYRRSWELTLEQFRLLREHPCTYCGFPLPEAGCGLDRIDNAKGYLLDNVVPCCTSCNAARNDHFTHEEMLRDIGPVLRKVKLARTPEVAYTPEATSSPFEAQNAHSRSIQ